MKQLKHLIAVAAIVLIGVLITKLSDPDNPNYRDIVLITALLSLAFLMFNLAVRRSLSFKGYFTSKYNVLTNKVWSEKVFDIPKDLMYEKMIEVIKNSGFKIVDVNANTYEILAISKITFISWGENIYISFEAKGDETIMKFCSSTFLGAYDWGKNEKNYNKLVNEIDLSFTV